MKSSEQTQHAEVINARENIAKVFGSAPPAEQHHEREATPSLPQNAQGHLVEKVYLLNELAPKLTSSISDGDNRVPADQAGDEKNVAKDAEDMKRYTQFICQVGAVLIYLRATESVQTVDKK